MTLAAASWAEASGVEHQVVVRWVNPVVTVDLPDVGGPVCVGLLHPAVRLLFDESEALH